MSLVQPLSYCQWTLHVSLPLSSRHTAGWFPFRRMPVVAGPREQAPEVVQNQDRDPELVNANSAVWELNMENSLQGNKQNSLFWLDLSHFAELQEKFTYNGHPPPPHE